GTRSRDQRGARFTGAGQLEWLPGGIPPTASPEGNRQRRIEVSASLSDECWSKTMMEYKGYRARVEFDDEAELFHGEVIGTRDVITFQGRSVEELKTAFADSVDDYLEFCASQGKAPDKPYSGR